MIKKENLNWQEMNAAIVAFGEKLLRGRGVGLFYYAGHGVQLDGKNYLIPVESNIRHENEVKYKAVDAGIILAEMENSRTRLNIVILDACRDNPFARSFRSSAGQGLAYMDAPTGIIIAYATAPGKTASDGPGKNGIYTSELIRQIQTPELRLVDMFNRVRKAVRTRTNGRQIPWESTSLEGAFYFKLPQKDIASSDGSAHRNAVIPQSQNARHGLSAEISPGQTMEMKPEAGEVWKDPVTGMAFVWVPEGCYQMGCGSWAGQCDKDEEPVHNVCVNGFWMGKYEVTQAQWEQMMKNNPSSFKKGDNYPVEQVSWNDVKDFIQKLNTENSGQYKFRLPTEAEWEYACRGLGKHEKYCGGDDLSKLGWYDNNSGGEPHLAETKAANNSGLYHMSGNVWEWCEDWYESYSSDSVRNPGGPSAGSTRVIRGGIWFDDEDYCRSVNRHYGAPDYRNDDIGFRLLRTP